MPIHDWTRVDANVFHDFHQSWAMQIKIALNAGLLPKGFSALVEQHAAGLVPDVLAIERRPQRDRPLTGPNVLTVKPQMRYHVTLKEEQLAQRANRVVIRHAMGEVVSMIEIVSPGNKAGHAGMQSFLRKTHEFLSHGVHVMVLDLFPPTPRDPHGIHKAIWDEYNPDEPFTLLPHKPLTLASYVAAPFGNVLEAFVEAVAVGDVLPNMPVYLDAEHYIWVPLEETYQKAWLTNTEEVRHFVEHGHWPDEENPS